MLLALHFVVNVCAPAVAGQQTPEPRPRQIASIVYEGDMAGLLAKLAQEYGTNIGLELTPGRPKISVKIDLRNDPTLHDVLDAIVRSAQGYRWREADGAVEVSPAQGGCPLLDAIVEDFQVSGVSQAEAVDHLISLPEVRAGMGALNLRYGEHNGPPSRTPGEKVSMSLKGASVRQVLHQIAGRGGGRFWSFRRYGNRRDGELFKISTPDRW
jgi:hypothetical protein